MSNHGSNDLSASRSFKVSTLFLERHMMNQFKVHLSDLNFSRRARMRGVTRLCAVALGLTLGFGSTAAFALVDQDGRVTSTTNVDGATVNITPSSFNAASTQCVIYSVLLYDNSSPRHIETGVVGCNGANIDGTCTSGHGFSERYDGSAYYCAQGSTFTTGSATNALIERSSGTTAMWGSTAGSYISQSGFGATDSIQSYAWAEATGASTCPSSPHSGAFTSWRKFINASGWSYVTSAPTYIYGQFATSPCWTVGSLSSTGDFNAS